MTTATVDRLMLRYLAGSGQGIRSRLDRVARTGTERGLRRAHEAFNLAPDQIVCVRRLTVPTVLQLADTDDRLADAMAAAISDRLRSAAGSGDAVVVSYSSRQAGLADMLRRIASGDTDRRWAWRQLGWWPATAASDAGAARTALLQSLSANATAAAPLLADVARRGGLPRLVAILGERALTDVAAAVLGRIGAVGVPGISIDAGHPVPGGAASQSLEGDLDGSMIRRAVAAYPELASSPRMRRALAALALAETAPVRLRGPRGTARRAIDRAERLLATMPEVAGPGPSADSAPAPGPTTPADRAAASSVDRSPGPAPDPGAGAGGTEPVLRRETLGESGMGRADPAGLGSGISPEKRQRLATDYGGIAFLIPVIEDLGLQISLAHDPAFADRSFREALHLLAMRLAPISSADAAGLVLAGHDLTAAPPPPPMPARPREGECLDAMVSQITLRLEALLQDRSSAEPLLAYVVERRAEVLADPGWVELAFDADAVSLPIRRAGLDLDPGFVPWLGTVVRYRYA